MGYSEDMAARSIKLLQYFEVEAIDSKEIFKRYNQFGIKRLLNIVQDNKLVDFIMFRGGSPVQYDGLGSDPLMKGYAPTSFYVYLDDNFYGSINYKLAGLGIDVSEEADAKRYIITEVVEKMLGTSIEEFDNVKSRLEVQHIRNFDFDELRKRCLEKGQGFWGADSSCFYSIRAKKETVSEETSREILMNKTYGYGNLFRDRCEYDDAYDYDFY